ncbi:PTS galactitol transporter subunit IIC [Brevibacillus marinus]|uniref:PTS galactitol transporter subunit IIC n=1 Tax=Brevibacillus marinus TaxID=2496837 RepID=UPI000F843841|nr:PTS transporter subunit IIC [Brevibacillus marinus]
MFLETLKHIFDTFGAQIFVPFIIFIVALFLKVQVKKAFFAALYAGIGLQGFTLLLNAFIPVILPVVQQMVESTGVKLPVFDIGWQATAVVAYSTQVGMIFLGLGILLQIFLFLTRWTNVFQPGDLWNNYSYMVWGSMIYLLTKNMVLAIACMVVMNLYSLLFSEMLARRWSAYYNYPNCTIVQLHHVGSVPFGIAMNWILNKLGANKIQLGPSDLQKKLGFLGEPILLGLLLGLFLGVMGNLKELVTLSSWGEIATVGVATAAVMAIFPKVSGIFAQAFLPLTEAAKKAGKQGSKSREWYLGVNDAAGYGETATLISGITLIPIMLVMALILPGNQVLPVVDLIALPFMVEGLVAIMNGNIFKVLVSGTIWFSLGLYMATYTAPIFTQVAAEVGVSIPSGVLLITSFGILTKPIVGLIFLAFLSQSWVWIGLVIAIYAVSYFLFKRNKEAFYDFVEKMNTRAA